MEMQIKQQGSQKPLDRGIGTTPNIPQGKINPDKTFSMFSKCSFATTSSMFFK